MTPRGPDIVCLSHLRWDFVYQRPNHLMARAARSRRVFYVEEPERRGTVATVETEVREGVVVVRPILPESMPAERHIAALRLALDGFLASEGVERPWLWYYTPMALEWTEHVPAGAVIYDCMDELSGFKFAPPALRELERKLIERSDVLFTGGRTLYEAKRNLHPRAYLFPSSVDAAHFAQARTGLSDPEDQAAIGRPRIGYFGVIDERIDLQLVAQISARRSDWNFVMVGPVAKVDEADLPRSPNLHWLGKKSYAQLPAYLAGWDVAIMPFALNESTRHISPTKTPEYLTGGRPVVSTPIRDVVTPYGEQKLVHIASTSDEFVAAVEQALACDRADLLARADRLLASHSWDATWAAMDQLVGRHAGTTRPATASRGEPAAPPSLGARHPAGGRAATRPALAGTSALRR